MNIAKRIHILSNGTGIPPAFLTSSKAAAAQAPTGSDRDALKLAIARHASAKRLGGQSETTAGE